MPFLKFCGEFRQLQAVCAAVGHLCFPGNSCDGSDLNYRECKLLPL